MIEKLVQKPTVHDWMRFLHSNMPPPGTKCCIIAVKASNAYMEVTSGPHKGYLFMAELLYNKEAYKQLPKFAIEKE